jgi:hypothetical protein
MQTEPVKDEVDLRDRIRGAAWGVPVDDGLEWKYHMHLMPWNIVRIKHTDDDSRMKIEATFDSLVTYHMNGKGKVW